MARQTDINITRDGQREIINKESEAQRPIVHSLSLWAIIAGGLAILFIEMALVGRQLGILLIFGGAAAGVMSLSLEYDEENKRYRLPYEKLPSHWILVMQVGVVLLVIALIDKATAIWWPVWWQLGDGYLWVSTDSGSHAYPGWCVLIRLFFILGLGAYYPIAPLTVWRFAAEIVLPQLPNLRFRPVTAEGVNAPYFGEILEPLEFEEEPPKQPTYSERKIDIDPNKTKVTGGMASSPAKRNQGYKIVRISSDVATEAQLEVLAVGIFNEGRNFSRNYWSKHGLFSDGGWRKFQKWMDDNGYLQKFGNSYTLNDEGEAWLRAYLNLSPTP